MSDRPSELRWRFNPAGVSVVMVVFESTDVLEPMETVHFVQLALALTFEGDVE